MFVRRNFVGERPKGRGNDLRFELLLDLAKNFLVDARADLGDPAQLFYRLYIFCFDPRQDCVADKVAFKGFVRIGFVFTPA